MSIYETTRIKAAAAREKKVVKSIAGTISICL
jgi:hypothetical protein